MLTLKSTTSIRPILGSDHESLHIIQPLQEYIIVLNKMFWMRISRQDHVPNCDKPRSHS